MVEYESLETTKEARVVRSFKEAFIIINVSMHCS